MKIILLLTILVGAKYFRMEGVPRHSMSKETVKFENFSTSKCFEEAWLFYGSKIISIFCRPPVMGKTVLSAEKTFMMTENGFQPKAAFFSSAFFSGAREIITSGCYDGLSANRFFSISA